MIFVVLKSGDCVPIDAVSVRRREDQLVCTDSNSIEVAVFLADDVEVYTRSEREARALQDVRFWEGSAKPVDPVG